jgi:hypothetical protein
MKNKRLLIAKQMPELKHKAGEGSFDITKSEVLKWLIQQPDILNYLMDQVKDKGLIKYNPERGTWYGVNYVKE